MRRRAALVLAGLAWTSLLLAAGVTALGAIAVPSVGLSISGPSRLWVATLILWSAAALAVGGPRRLLESLTTSATLPATTVTVSVALALALLVTRGATGVGGADSAGYLAQAERWAAGELREPLPRDPAMPASPWVRTPLGFRPDPTETLTVPSYPPGLPLLQAGALLVGGERAAIRVLPAIAIAAALIALFVLARRVSDPSPAWRGPSTLAPLAVTGAGAAVATMAFASLPTVLFQALQPMSDVPALAAWLTALACGSRPGQLAVPATTLATFLAIAIRPNLAPLALVVAWQARHAGVPLRARILAVAAAAAAAIVLVAAVQWHLYGSPLQSGYGSAADLFSLRHLPINLWLYPQWLRDSSSTPALVLLSAGAGALAARAPFDRRLRPLLAVIVIVAALYLVYVPFDSWTYLRFVLLAIAMAAVGVAILVEAGLAYLRYPWRVPAFIVCALAATLPNLRVAQELGVFGVREREARYLAAGEFVRERLPDARVVLAGQHSGSVSYYARRPILRADLIDRNGLDRATATPAPPAGTVAIVLDVAEVDPFRRRLAGAPAAALDWPPRAEIGRPVMTRVWLASDRQAYRAGRHVPTARIVPPGR